MSLSINNEFLVSEDNSYALNGPWRVLDFQYIEYGTIDGIRFLSLNAQCPIEVRIRILEDSSEVLVFFAGDTFNATWVESRLDGEAVLEFFRQNEFFNQDEDPMNFQMAGGRKKLRKRLSKSRKSKRRSKHSN